MNAVEIMIYVKCRACEQPHHIGVPAEDVEKWKYGAHVHVAFPYLDAGTRELLISGICERCFDTMFAGDGDE